MLRSSGESASLVVSSSVNAISTLSACLQTTRAVKHEDVELPAAALISDADKKLLTRLWSVLIPRGVEEVSAARFLSFLQVSPFFPCLVLRDGE